MPYVHPKSTETAVTTPLSEAAIDIDHIAVAVPDLEASVDFFTRVLGFVVTERRETKGVKTGMISAVLKAGPITIVLSRGPRRSRGREVRRPLRPGRAAPRDRHPRPGGLRREAQGGGRGVDTNVINGKGLLQIFTKRDQGSGQMFEFIEHTAPDGDFSDQSVEQLFRQLEEKDPY